MQPARWLRRFTARETLRRPGSNRHTRRPCRPSEVEGTLGQIAGPVVLVQTERDVDALELAPDTPVAYITQTTLSVDDTRAVITALKRRFPRYRRAGHRRYLLRDSEPAIGGARLVDAVDLLLVVGARNSSNSNRLREIGVEAGVPSYLIADGSELDPEWVRGVSVVGLTAGASAPEALVEDVIAALRRLGPVEFPCFPSGREGRIRTAAGRDGSRRKTASAT
jgi:4-hydroxy-3-methylbut-2-enyl diphosphate reductase